jgi:DNA repair and recombination protein RAD52
VKFTEAQITLLAAPLNAKNVKSRDQSGRTLSYIEGWWAIREANRIFGFDGWARETIDLRMVSEKGRQIGKPPNTSLGWGVTYIARVRITVGTVIIREGCGTGHGIDRDLGQAHESALKEAETDAMKRALMTFGNSFGLALYDKEQTEVQHGPDPDVAEGVKNWMEKQTAIITAAERLPDLYMWLDEHGGSLTDAPSGSAFDRLKRKAPDAYKDLCRIYQGRVELISRKTAPA